MIDRIEKGRNVVRLLYYLYGPGKSDEHENPHLVAAWRDDLASLEPPVKPNGQRDFRRLGGLLNAPLDVVGRLGLNGTVWHCVLSAAPTDRLLTDAEWNAIAAEFMDQMGLAPRDDPAGVRWVAVRHGLSAGGIDHIHIAATLARQDGRLPSVHNDFIRARRACLAIERQFGLTFTAPADRTAAVRPTRAETELSARTGRAEEPRVALRRVVQETGAIAVGEADFFTRLQNAGMLVRERRSDRDPGRITGYAVALPDHTAQGGDPVWFGGGKLAPDLSLQQLRRRWERTGNIGRSSQTAAQELSARSARAFLRSAVADAAAHTADEGAFFRRLGEAGVLVRLRHSEHTPWEDTGYAVSLPGHVDAHGNLVWHGGGRLGADLTLPRLRGRWRAPGPYRPLLLDPADRQALWADVISMTTASIEQFQNHGVSADAAAATADTLRLAARAIRGSAARDLRQAAAEFDRAAREPFGSIPEPSQVGRKLRTATQFLAALGTASSGTAGSMITFVTNLAELTSAVAELRLAQARTHQAAAARAAADRLARLAGTIPAASARTALATPDRPDRADTTVRDDTATARPLSSRRPRPPSPRRPSAGQRGSHGPAP